MVKTTYNWEAIDPNTLSGFPKLNSERSEYDGLSDVFSQTDYTYHAANGYITTNVQSGTSAEVITESIGYENLSTAPNGQLWRRTSEILSGQQTGIARHTTYAYEQGTGNLLQKEMMCQADAGEISDCTGSYSLKYAYDTYGNLVKEWDANTPKEASPTVTTIYDSATQTYPEEIINALGHTTKQTWDVRFGKLLSRIDPNGNRTEFANDGFGRLYAVSHPDGGKTMYEYSDRTLPRFIQTRVMPVEGTFDNNWEYFDGLGRSIQTSAPSSPAANGTARYVITKTHYDAFGRAFLAAGPFFNAGSEFLNWGIGNYPEGLASFYKTTAYDPHDRPMWVKVPDDQSESKESITNYAYEGFATTITDPDNCVTIEVRDHMGRIAEVIERSDAHGEQTTRYGYNAAGDLTVVRNPLFATLGESDKTQTSIFYNTLGRKVRLIDPDLGMQTYSYDANGNLRFQTDNAGNTVEFQYDTLNRLIRKIYPRGSDPRLFNYLYDTASANGIGRPHKVLTGPINYARVSKSFDQYDPMGRVLAKSVRIEGDSRNYTLNYAYDLTGKPLQITYPHTGEADDFRVDYGYHPGTDLLQSVKDGDGNLIAQLDQYTPSGKIGKIHFGNNVETVYSYGPDSQRLHSIQTAFQEASGNYMDLSYHYSPAGDIVMIDDGCNCVTRNYVYDKLHRLTESHITGEIRPLAATELVYSYEDDGGAFPLHAPAEITSNSTRYRLGYDLNGNLTDGWDFKTPNNPAKRTITFTAENMADRVVHKRFTTEFLYDGDGKRAKKIRPDSATYYIDDVYEINTGTGKTTQYIFAGNLRIAQRKDDIVTYIHKDHLGSTGLITGPKGWLVEYSDYLPYGMENPPPSPPAPNGDSNPDATGFIATTPYNFTDQELDVTTWLYNYDARLYDPVVGRFISADSIVPNLYDPQSLDRYAYVRNNPLVYIDPSGHQLGSINEYDGREVGSNSIGWDDNQRDSYGKRDYEYTREWGNEVVGQYAKGILNNDFDLLSDLIKQYPDYGVTYELTLAEILRSGLLKNASAETIVGAIAIGIAGRGGLGGASKNITTPKNVQKLESQRAAFRKAKRDAGIPTSQTHSTHTKNLKADALDTKRSATEYDFGGGRKIQRHPDGHTFNDGSTYPNRHFNNHGTRGTGGHYEY